MSIESKAITTIRPSRMGFSLNFQELWRYRELLYFLTWRDIKVRYKQTVIGAAWAILQPFLTMVVFSIFFGYLAKIPSDGIPYPIFVYCALLPWQLFSHALVESGNSLVANQQLITKVYFPRLMIPLSSALTGLLDFFIAFVVLVLMMFYYGMMPNLSICFLPFFVLMAILASLGFGLWLSALNVRYRDVRYTIPFLNQFWFFLTPIGYSSSLVPEALRPLYGLNPMAGVVEGFRWALLGKTDPPGLMMAVSVLISLAVFIGGVFYFNHVEKTFADVI
jgi:lipopolysaccharide transport system permease protein